MLNDFFEKPSKNAFCTHKKIKEAVMSGKSESKIYGYVRVSTKEQNEDRQMMALNEVGVPRQNIYADKQSGKDFNRPQYRKLL